jgi:DNA processing protein
VHALVQLTPLDPDYPSRLRYLDEAPPSLATRGGSLEAERAVAVVGSRAAVPAAIDFATSLARALVAAQAVVVSGGAEGIDAAAHRGALEAAGRTWAVAPTGHGQCFPVSHAPLFEAIAAGPGAMLWPFADGYHHRSAFLARNRVLVALSDAVVVIQAGMPSGALHAASCARQLKKPLWVVPAAPWMEEFAGSRRLLEEGALPLTSIDVLLSSLGLDRPSGPQARAPDRALSRNESRVLSALSHAPLHLDAIAVRAGRAAHETAAALLTLALENVVVEGPPGFFRRR